jgi:aspartyl-tRNA(Asn)/glutamyl-tRNA(Gln) amidotransferase subunit B
VKAGGVIVQETRDYDGLTGTSQSLRSKEMAHDYRYFPDPDLMPVKVDEAWKARLDAELPERPFDKQRRFMAAEADGGYALPYTLASVLVPDRELSDWFETAAKLAGPALAQPVGNWIVNDLQRELAAAGVALGAAKITPAALAELVKLIAVGTLLQNTAKEVFAEMFATGETPAAIVARKGLAAAPTDSAELETWCRESIAANAKAVAEFKAGKESALNGLKGPVMKAAKGKADPKAVDETLRRLLAAL